MDINFLAAVIGILATVIAGARYLLGVYYKKEDTILKLRHDAIKKEINDIEDIIKDLRSVVSNHADKIKELQLSIEKNFLRYQAQADSVKIIAGDLKEFSKDIKDEVNSMKRTVIQITQDVAVLKTKKF